MRVVPVVPYCPQPMGPSTDGPSVRPRARHRPDAIRTRAAALNSMEVGPIWIRSRPGHVSDIELHHAADIDSGREVVIAVLYLIERVFLGDQLVHLKQAGLVQTEKIGDLHPRAARAEDRSEQGLIEHWQVEQIERHFFLGDRSDGGRHYPAVLAGQLHGGPDQITGEDPGGENRSEEHTSELQSL